MKRRNISIAEKYKALEKKEEGKSTKKVSLMNMVLRRITFPHGLQTKE